MNSIDIIRMTFKNLLRRKTRTMLTVMGVVIGTASIVIMISIGIGMSEGFKQEISRMGSLNTINIRSAGEVQQKSVIWMKQQLLIFQE